MDLCISCIPQRVKSSAPWSDSARDCQQHQETHCNHEDGENKTSKKRLELFAGYLLTDKFNEGNELQKTKDACICEWM